MKEQLHGFDFECCRGMVAGCPHSLYRGASLVDELFSIAFASRWEEKFSYLSFVRHHQKLQIGISACPNACARVQIKDIGILLRCQVTYLQEKCTSCGECVSTCREGALSLTDNGIEIDKNRCLGCGDCVSACSEEALIKQRVFYEIMLGGRLGRHPRFAIPIAKLTREEEVVSFFKKVVYLLDSNLHLEAARGIFGIYSLDFFKELLPSSSTP